MSTYHLQARLLVGPLSRPERDETRTSAGDDLDELLAVSRALSAQGFTVWIYDHGHPAPLPGASDYRTVVHLPADRAMRDDPGRRAPAPCAAEAPARVAAGINPR